MHARKLRGWLALSILFVITVSACAAPTPEPTKPPPPPAAVSSSVASAPAATKAPTTPPTAVPTTGPKRGGKVTMVVSQSPVTLNSLLGTQTVQGEVTSFVIEGLTFAMPDASRAPGLAKQVPSLQNGGVSADGKTITYKLKEGILWSDGKPFTCDDVKFTWQAIMTPGAGVVITASYTDIETVECPDPHTAVVKFKNFFAPYQTLFGVIIPKSAGDPKDMKNWAYNRKPIGTGPFKIDEWVADSYVTLSRNENYRDAKEGKPYLDQIVVRIVPSVEAAMQLLQSGEVDIMWNNSEADLPLLEKMTGVKISAPLQIGGERLFLNLAENKDPSDPKKPHPILSDVKVRLAIDYGINKQRILDKLLFGKAKPTASELNEGFFTCADLKPRPNDPEKAKQLLTEAGWIPGTDGIRVAKGAKVAPDGTRLRLKYSTTSGNKLREDTQVLVIEDLKAIGMELYVENAPSAVVIGTWDANSPRARGNFDLIMYTTPGGGANSDPHVQMVNLWSSAQIPSPDNKGGRNYTRFADPKADDILKQATVEPDVAKRKALYCQLNQMTYEQANMIYLYQRLDIDSYRDRLQGWIGNPWANNAWNAESWWVK